MNLRILIVDDARLARQELRTMLAGIPGAGRVGKRVAGFQPGQVHSRVNLASPSRGGAAIVQW